MLINQSKYLDINDLLEGALFFFFFFQPFGVNEEEGII